MMEEDDSLPQYLPKEPGVPRWLFWSYILIPLGGILIFALFWNGSFGWFDRGSWAELQSAANTKYPFTRNVDETTAAPQASPLLP